MVLLYFFLFTPAEVDNVFCFRILSLAYTAWMDRQLARRSPAVIACVQTAIIVSVQITTALIQYPMSPRKLQLQEFWWMIFCTWEQMIVRKKILSRRVWSLGKYPELLFPNWIKFGRSLISGSVFLTARCVIWKVNLVNWGVLVLLSKFSNSSLIHANFKCAVVDRSRLVLF